MDSNTKNIEKLKRLLSLMDEDALTREEFTKNFKNVLDLVNKIKEVNARQFDLFSKDFSDFKTKLESKSDTRLKGFERNISEISDKVSMTNEEISAKITEFINRLDNFENVKPTDEERVIETALSRIKFPEYKETILDTPEQIRDKLETLEGEERLRIDAINGLKEALDELKKKKYVISGGGGISTGALDIHIVDDETPVGTINGSNKAFTINNTPSPASSLKVYLNGARQRITEDYTLSGTTITFNVAPPTSSILLVDYRI